MRADPQGTADLVFSRDVYRAPSDPQHHAVNLGNFFARNTSCARAVLRAISTLGYEGLDEYWCIGHYAHGQDQCSLQTILGEAGLGKDLEGAVKYAPHRAFNAMVSDGK